MKANMRWMIPVGLAAILGTSACMQYAARDHAGTENSEMRPMGAASGEVGKKGQRNSPIADRVAYTSTEKNEREEVRRGPKASKRPGRVTATAPQSIAMPEPRPSALARDASPHTPGFNTEQYDHIEENRFHLAVGTPVSTFSIDVDTAAYANVRRFLTSGRLPVRDAVRIEELVNYFTYDYPEPSDDTPFSFTTELSDCLWNPGHKLLHIGLQAKKLSLEDLPPNNLVFLLDVSGSMNNPQKLPLLVSAFKLLVNEMREQDRVAIVVYAGAAGLVLPSTPGNEKNGIIAALEKLRAGGSTAGAAGVTLAYQVARENFDPDGNNRVILATDGDFNVGVSSDSELVQIIEAEREHGVFLTVLGFGTGNYKDSKMEKLANKGNGNFAYIDTISEAKKVLVSEMGGTLVAVAKDVKVQIEFNPAKVREYRLVGYENRVLAREDFDDDTKDAGELGSGHTVTVLYEIVPETEAPPASTLRYQDARVTDQSEELAFLKLRYKQPGAKKSTLVSEPVSDTALSLADSSDNFKFSAAVAAWGMLLRGSEHKGNTSFGQIRELGADAIGPDLKGYRAEFLGLVAKSAELASNAGPVSSVLKD